MGVYFFATPSQGGGLTGEALAAGDERHPGVLPAAPNQELPCSPPPLSWIPGFPSFYLLNDHVILPVWTPLPLPVWSPAA